MKEILVPLKVIEVKTLEFNGKDIITVKKWDDFIELCRGSFIVYKLADKLYLINDTVAFVYDEKCSKTPSPQNP